jgi:DNA-directed RNA polymerase sigma subunit (sigma70/sigma32)
MSERRLLNIPQVGPKAVADVSEALRDPRVASDGSIELVGALAARVVSERDGQLVRMRQSGESIRVIARRFGISPERVRQILDRDGW